MGDVTPGMVLRALVCGALVLAVAIGVVVLLIGGGVFLLWEFIKAAA